MAEALDDFRTIDVHFDTANDIVPPIRLNAGDINGRRIRIIVTDRGKPVNGEGMTARLLWNIAPSSPTSGGGIDTMTLEAYQLDETHTTAAWAADVSRHLLLNGGRTSVAGLEITKTNGDVICSSNIDVIVEAAVIRATAPEILDPLKELHDALKNSQEADSTATEAKKTAEQAVEIANQAKATAEELVNEASTSAKAAAASEKNAKTSETNAAASASAAKTSETAAKASQDAAASSATQAADSSEQAGSHAEAASASATQAAASAKTATDAAESSTQSKNAAADSAGAAKASETAAKASQDAAAASAAAAADAAEHFNVEVRTVTKLPAGSEPTASAEKVGAKWAIDLGLVTGDRGENTAAISEVTASYVPGGTTPGLTVTAGGTPENRTLHFEATGLEGPDGHTPTLMPGTVTSLPEGSQPTFELVADPDTPWAYTVNMGIPAGHDGSDATVTAGAGITVTDGSVAVKPKTGGAVTADAGGVAVAVDGTTIRIVDGVLTGAGQGASVATETVTFTPDAFDDNLTATLPVPNAAGAKLLVGPNANSIDNVRLWAEAQPIAQGHDNVPEIPDGSLRLTLTNELTADLAVEVWIFKEA
ncbi:hypothetical protein CSQ85_01655 [Bifidobacterium rousetti]|uniref:hypothetical protein n=1 Tax=Bifidobacterium rousetti TaxID=2045439 RepID=UPI00123ACFFA|nr:hypothetical protein [Bifidobacterium rousetti]KAA8820511.1 hypothetical protein CSQ85_01655 [Bifidobacterium rousetti]